MTDENNRVERRKHKRLEIRGNAYVAVGPDFHQVGRLADISMGGLSFRYMADQKGSNGASLDIFSTDRDFYFGYVPFKEVSDLQTHDAPLSSTAMRRRSVRFGELSPYQIKKLEYLMRSHMDERSTNDGKEFSIEDPDRRR
jgi:c-di-GMP-binding flagellar brake protein YcgR